MSNPNTPDPYQQQPGDSGPPPPPGGNPDLYGNAGQPPAPESSGYGDPGQTPAYGGPDQSGYGGASTPGYGAPQSGYGAPDQSGYPPQDPQGGYSQGGYGGQNPGGPPPAGGYTSPTGYQPEPAPKKSSGGAVLAAIIALIVGIGLGLGGGFLIWGGSDEEVNPAASATPTESAEPTDSPETEASTPEPTEEQSDEPVAPETTDAPATSGDEGTRKNPLPIGTEVTIGDWAITLDNPKDGTKVIADENQFNDAPEDGFEFYLVPMTATYKGDESAYVWADLSVQFVGDDGRTYSDYCGVFPDDITSVGELYEGGVAEGNSCVMVPAGAKGLWTVSAFLEDPIFFSAK